MAGAGRGSHGQSMNGAVSLATTATADLNPNLFRPCWPCFPPQARFRLTQLALTVSRVHPDVQQGPVRAIVSVTQSGRLSTSNSYFLAPRIMPSDGNRLSVAWFGEPGPL
jgi:hypothetical protein